MPTKLALLKQFARKFWLIPHHASLILLLSATLTALLETAGLFLLWPMIGLFIAPHGGSNSAYGVFLARYTPFSPEHAVLLASLVLVGVYMLKNMIMLGSSMYEVNCLSRWKAKITDHVYQKLLFAPYTFQLSHSSNDLMQLLTSTIPYVIDNFINQLFAIISHVLILLCIAVLVVTLISPATLLAVGVAIIITIGLHFLMRRLANVLGEKYLNNLRTNSAILLQTFTAFREIHIYQVASTFRKRFKENNIALCESQKWLNFMEKIPGLANEVLLIVVLLIVLNITGAHSHASNPQQRLQELGILVMAFFRMTPTLNRIMTATVMIHSATQPLHNLLNMLKQLQHENDGTMPRSRPKEQPKSVTARITLSNVSFSYQAGQVLPVLSDISCTINPGEWVGLVGNSGSGKSTLLNILMGFLRPTSGHITLGKENIFSAPHVWRSRVAAVFQDFTILNASIAENIAFGVPLKSIDMARVNSIIDMVELRELVDNLHDGCTHHVGENGKLLSGGQRQRLAIARALYFDKDIWLLDECTSALDTQTETHILTMIRQLPRKITVIMAAHRPNAYQTTDRIVYLEQGRISFDGPTKAFIQQGKKS